MKRNLVLPFVLLVSIFGFAQADLLRFPAYIKCDFPNCQWCDDQDGKSCHDFDTSIFPAPMHMGATGIYQYDDSGDYTRLAMSEPPANNPNAPVQAYASYKRIDATGDDMVLSTASIINYNATLSSVSAGTYVELQAPMRQSCTKAAGLWGCALSRS